MENPQNQSRKGNIYLQPKYQIQPGNKVCTKKTPTKNLRVKKVIPNPTSSCAGKNEADNYFILMDVLVLKIFIQKVCICSECMSNNVTLSNNANLRMGLSCNLELVCNDCLHQISFYTSKECSKLEQKNGRNPYEINLRTVSNFSRNWKGA